MTEISPKLDPISKQEVVAKEGESAQLDPFAHLESLKAEQQQSNASRSIRIGRLKFWGYDLVAIVIAVIPFVFFAMLRELLVAVSFAAAVSIWFAIGKLYVARFITRRADEYRRVTNAWAKSAATVIAVSYTHLTLPTKA